MFLPGISLHIFGCFFYCLLYFLFSFYTFALCVCRLYRVIQKTAQSLWHHNFATVRHRVPQRFLAKCSERNSLHDKDQRLNRAIKYFLFCCWQVNCLKSILTAAFILCKFFNRDKNNVHVKSIFQN